MLTKNSAGGRIPAPGGASRATTMMSALRRSAHRPRRGNKLVLVGTAAALAVLFPATTRTSFGADPSAREAPAGMAVSVAKAKWACFSDTLVAIGTVVPRQEVLVRPDREGLQIKEILVEPGDTVAAAQVLARLSPANEQQQGSIVAIRAPVGGIIVGAPKVVGEMASARESRCFVSSPMATSTSRPTFRQIAHRGFLTISRRRSRSPGWTKCSAGCGRSPRPSTRQHSLGKCIFRSRATRCCALVSLLELRSSWTIAVASPCRCRRCCSGLRGRWCK